LSITVNNLAMKSKMIEMFNKKIVYNEIQKFKIIKSGNDENNSLKMYEYGVRYYRSARQKVRDWRTDIREKMRKEYENKSLDDAITDIAVLLYEAKQCGDREKIEIYEPLFVVLNKLV